MSHRRRKGVGVSRSANKYVARKADEMKAVSLQQALDTVEKLETNLQRFSIQHKDKIQNDPVFRHRFLQMCAPLGIDPILLANEKAASSKKTIWNKILGMGDFYHQLAVHVAEVCLASRSTNGGIMSVAEVQQRLRKRTSRLGTVHTTVAASKEDIAIAVKNLGKLGGGFRLIDNMILSVPTELNTDHTSILVLAQSQPDRGLQSSEVQEALGWDNRRTHRAFEVLLQQNMVWIDQHRGETLYWFPSVWQSNF